MGEGVTGYELIKLTADYMRVHSNCSFISTSNFFNTIYRKWLLLGTTTITVLFTSTALLESSLAAGQSQSKSW